MRILVLALLLAALPATAQTPACTTAPVKPTGSVTATGCVAPGVEAGCRILVDAKTGKSYSIFFEGIAPAIGTAITISGEPFKGVSTCMQSNPITVKTCAIVQRSCPTPAKPVLAQ
jgi:hypothetical protein